MREAPEPQDVVQATPSEPVAPRPEERRCAERVELETEVSLFSDTTFWSGITEDISTGGVFVATYQLLEIGARIELALELPTGACIRTECEVRWLRLPRDGSGAAPGMGLRFLALSEDELRLVRSFVKHRPPLLWDDE